MVGRLSKVTIAIGVLLLMAMVLVGVLGTTSASATSSAKPSSKPWSFGVISDTQWTVADDGFNPNTVAANIIKQIDGKFAQSGVKFVVAVGDTVNEGSKVNIDTRALYAQDLYNAGIGFYPLRGNHEVTEDLSYHDSGSEFRTVYPQIMTGVNNNTPKGITTSIIPAADLANNAPAGKRGKTFTVGTNFSEPAQVNQANNSVSYSFQYANATFVLLDQFNGNYDNNTYYDSTIPQQQSWIDGVLSSRPANTHAFVFAHKNILGGNHKDNMFGGQVTSNDPGDGSGLDLNALTQAQKDALTMKQSAENTFLASMQANEVDVVVSGHDHHHYESVVTSPDGASKVRQLITQSDSSKFYTPGNPTSANDAAIEQDLGRVGYYIFTVDGPNVTMDYYADVNGGADYGLDGATFDFEKISTSTYSLNGTSTVVDQTKSYSGISANTTLAASMESGFHGTSVSILGGTNGSIATTNYGKKLSHQVDTAWTPGDRSLASDILTLSGMSRTIGSAKTDAYTLSMTYSMSGVGMNSSLAKGGKFGILTQDSNGRWIKAVDKNFGTSQKFVLGAWNANYKLGTYGIDPIANTAWAVLNYNSSFAVGFVGTR